MKLSGRNTLITGGSQGLGRVIVEAFLAEGANVVFCARTAADVAQTQSTLNSQLKTGQQLVGLTCDIADPTSVAALFARAAQLGPLHVVVNNAGIYGPIGPTEEVALTDWTQAWQVNVTGTLLVCQQAIRAMKPRRAGKIITISGGGATNPMPRFAAYAATKAAVVRLTETLAEIAEQRDLRILLGDPVAELAGVALASTFAPVPGYQRRVAKLNVVAAYPYPWARRPGGGDVRSHSAWIRNSPSRR